MQNSRHKDYTPTCLNILHPKNVTINGVDDTVSFEEILEISLAYRVRWGIQFDPEKAGTPGYPSLGWIFQFSEWIERYDHKRALGEDEYQYYDSIFTQIVLPKNMVDTLVEEEYLGHEDLLRRFNRISLLTEADTYGPPIPERLVDWSKYYKKELVLNLSKFPDNDNYNYIQNLSYGKGNYPGREAWQKSDYFTKPAGTFRPGLAFRTRHIGYEGGITAANVIGTCWYIGDKCNTHYDISVTSGVTHEGEFSLRKVHELLETVYGKRVYNHDENDIEVYHPILKDLMSFGSFLDECDAERTNMTYDEYYYLE